MFQKLNPTFALISLTVIFWTGAVVLADLTAQSPETKQQQHTAPAVPPALKELEDKVNANPADTGARLELAANLVSLGEQDPSSGQIIAGITQYAAVLQTDPNNREALHVLAELSLENGVLDKALDYYTRYLALEPNDLKAQNDFALVLIQVGRADEAVTLLRSLIEKNAEAFPVQLSLAVAYKVSGKETEAAREAEKARKLAPNEEAARVVDDFIANLSNTQAETGATPDASAPMPVANTTPPPGLDGETTSPASAITSYFKSHPILGSKISALSWPDAQTVKFELANFPIASMPPFAKVRLTENAQKALTGLKEEFSVQFIDADSKALLMDFKVGGPEAVQTPKS